MPISVAILALWLMGCGDSAVECVSAETVLSVVEADSLTCGDIDRTRGYVETLAGRPIDVQTQRQLRKGLVAAHQRDAVGTRSAITKAVAAADTFVGATGIRTAERRSTMVWEVLHGTGAILPAGGARDARNVAIAPWAHDDAQKLVLTEMDIEGWMYYASLCHEVQGGDALSFSVATRMSVYNLSRERFLTASRDEQIAMSAMGAFWWDVKTKWQGAEFARQQAWIKAAPLPPPMDATASGYMESVLQSDLKLHAEVLHRQLGPLGLRSP